MDKKVIVVLGVVLILATLFTTRLVSTRQIDDVSPSRLCEDEFLKKSDILMVIPFLGNISLAENGSWCEYVKELNKTIGMHGIYHNGEEFGHPVDKESILRGMEEFNKCFGFYPVLFEAPELSLSIENENILKEMNFTIIKRWDYITHKVYHCTDYERTSWLVRLNFLNKIL